MNYTELIITLLLTASITILYIGLRKFIAWAIDDDDKWNKKQGHMGLKKETRDVNKRVAIDKLTRAYLLAIGLLVLYIIKLFFDAT